MFPLDTVLKEIRLENGKAITGEEFNNIIKA
jgi:hypothetical protein